MNKSEIREILDNPHIPEHMPISLMLASHVKPEQVKYTVNQDRLILHSDYFRDQKDAVAA